MKPLKKYGIRLVVTGYDPKKPRLKRALRGKPKVAKKQIKAAMKMQAP